MSPALRKAAILVSSLDTRSADALLDQMGEAQAARVRNAIMDLEEVDPKEQQQIIAEFLGNQQQPDTGAGGVELELSAQSKVESAAQGGTFEQPSGEPFAFLRQADGETIAACLERERPQIAAVVLAHLPPAHAAEVVAHLPPALRGEVLRRVARLDATEPTALRELEQHLQQSLAPYLRPETDATKGLETVEAILRASSAGVRNDMLARLFQSDALLAREMARSVAPATVPAKPLAQPAPKPQAADEPEPRPVELTFDDLVRLDERGWRVLLRISDPQVVHLALAGASPRLVERALAWLPREEAKRTRHKLEHPGPVSLRELDEARAELLELAYELEAEGRLRLPLPRRIAAAA
jgi:flagellar motor switch protein FliG